MHAASRTVVRRLKRGAMIVGWATWREPQYSTNPNSDARDEVEFRVDVLDVAEETQLKKRAGSGWRPLKAGYERLPCVLLAECETRAHVPDRGVPSRSEGCQSQVEQPVPGTYDRE